MTEDFLLDNDFSRRLYHNYAEKQPIFDYHCHLPPQQIAEDYEFRNLFDIWLKGDHYKWRAMRTNGVPEKFCTGNASDREKFDAWAGTVPYTIGNPLYHWSHLELRNPFGLRGVLLSSKTANTVWDHCNILLKEKGFTARGIIKKMNVKMIGTTDDPLDDLNYHKEIASDSSFDVKVLPSWRPDKVFNIESEEFLPWLERLESITDISILSFDDLRNAIFKRLDHFAEHGCKISDHALDTITYDDADDATLDRILINRRDGKTLEYRDITRFRSAILVWLSSEYSRRGWVQQYHIGALRNTNSAQFRLLGADTGFDSINDQNFAIPLVKLLSAQDPLPKTILYCLNPSDNALISTMIGNFQESGIVGKIQFGSAWWFNDQLEGMRQHMIQLASTSLLSRFIGMLTDSRSFLSYTRHEYFRRLLCQIIGKWVENGEAPADEPLLGKIVQDICFKNARDYFDIDVPTF